MTKETMSIYYSANSKSGKCPVCESESYHSLGQSSFPIVAEQGEKRDLKVYQIACGGCGLVMSFSSLVVDGTE
jgi:hypothetical protein